MKTTQDWLVVAPVEHVGNQQPLAVSSGGYEFALFRDTGDSIRAVENRCPHRRVPLAQGKIINGAIRCAYHGWTFEGSTGSCISVPNLGEQERVPPKLRVTAFRVIECLGFVCIWVGDGDVPDLPPFQAPETALPELETYGSGTVTLSIDDYRDILFDAPQLIFEIPGVRFTDFYLGDMTADGESLCVDREAEWGEASKPVNIKAVDRPLVLRAQHCSGVNKIRYQLMSDSEVVLATLALAYSESRRGTTHYCWRFCRYREFGRQQPSMYRLTCRRRAPVNVFDTMDGAAISSALVGPSADLASLSKRRIPTVDVSPV